MKIGLTGGTGSGKSYVAKLFEQIGVPVYYADKEAKRLMISSQALKADIKDLLGPEAYHRNGRLNRAYVANKIFSDKTLLQGINKLVHPTVRDDFAYWSQKQKYAYVLEESAIIYENKLQKYFDKVILVTAEKSVRIERVMKRDKANREQVENRMKNQLSDKKKVTLADFVLENNGTGKTDLISQIKLLDKELKKIAKQA